MASPTKKKTIKQNKLRSVPLEPMAEQTATNQPEVEPKLENKFETVVVGKHLRFSLVDPQGYAIAIDFVPIEKVSRASYNAVKDELILVLPETLGDIGEQMVPVYSSVGKKLNERKAITGSTYQYKCVVESRESITAFLKVYLGFGANEELPEGLFTGFESNDAMKAKVKEALDKKQAEEDAPKKSGLLDENGNPL